MKKICIALLLIASLTFVGAAVARQVETDEDGHVWVEKDGKYVCEGDKNQGHGPNCQKKEGE